MKNRVREGGVLLRSVHTAMALISIGVLPLAAAAQVQYPGIPGCTDGYSSLRGSPCPQFPMADSLVSDPTRTQTPFSGQYVGWSYPSRCGIGVYRTGTFSEPWSTPWAQYAEHFDALNIDLWVGATPGSYPPVSAFAETGTGALIPSYGAKVPRSVLPAERATANGVVDLITGMPLLHDEDLALPFGGAVYRHSRTHSATSHLGYNDLGVTWNEHYATPHGAFWDWYGLGWMSSERPFFLVDEAFAGTDFGPMDDGPLKRRCVFILDAHHSIPFELTEVAEGQWRYVAPAHFDAVLGHDGTMGTDGRWQTHPKHFYVWLYGNTVKYTIIPTSGNPDHTFNQDVFWAVATEHDEFGQIANTQIVDLHLPHPANPSVNTIDPNNIPVSSAGVAGNWGIPYGGIVESIEDINGHAIRFDYCAFEQTSSSETGCAHCRQKCNRKGQISRIRLQAGETTVWSLLFTHREFYGERRWQQESPDLKARQNPQQAVHSVHVYHGEVNFPSSGAVGQTCGTIPYTRFIQDHIESTTTSGGSAGDILWDQPVKYAPLAFAAALKRDLDLDPTVAITSPKNPWYNPNATGSGSLPENWQYEIKYVYADGSPSYTDSSGYTQTYSMWRGWGENLLPGQYNPSGEEVKPRLLATQVTKRGDKLHNSQTPAAKGWRLYTYQDDDNSDERRFDNVQIERIYDPRAVGAVWEAINDSRTPLTTLPTFGLDNSGNPQTLAHLPGSPADTATYLNKLRESFPMSLLMLRPLDPVPVIRVRDGMGSSEPSKVNTHIAWIPWREAASMHLRQEATAQDELPEIERRAFGSKTAATSDPYNFYGSEIMRELFSRDHSPNSTGMEYISIDDPHRCMALTDGVFVVGDRREDTTKGSWSKIYRFFVLPGSYRITPAAASQSDEQMPCAADNWGPASSGASGPATVDWSWLIYPSKQLHQYPNPYFHHGRVHEDLTQLQSSDTNVFASLDQPSWITVVDEYKSEDDARFKYRDTGTSPTIAQTKVRSRRVVEMNRFGLVIRERVWTFDPSQSQPGLQSAMGASESNIYDTFGRLVESRSAGWDAPSNASSTSTSGLITVYEYGTGAQQKLVKAVGVKQGTSGTVSYTKQYFHDSTEAPEEVTAEVEFLVPTSTLLSATPDIDDGMNGLVREFRVLSKTVSDYDPVSTWSSGGWVTSYRTRNRMAASAGFTTVLNTLATTEVYGFVRETFDAKGRIAWKTQGWAKDPLTNLATTPFRYSSQGWDYDESVDPQGRQTAWIVDPDPGAVSSGSLPIPSMAENGELSQTLDRSMPVPSEISSTLRAASSTAYDLGCAASLLTHYRYGQYGVERVRHPDGREDITKYYMITDGSRPPEDGSVKQVVWRDVVRKGGCSVSAELYSAWSQSVITPGSSEVMNTAAFSPAIDACSPQTGMYDEHTLYSSKVSMDAQGRPIALAATDSSGGGGSLAGSVVIDSFGLASRERSMDGTVTRQVTNAMGQVERVYRGSKDLHSFWANIAPTDTPDDDMILVEHRGYGNSVADANQLARSRRYNVYDSNQYSSATWLPAASSKGVIEEYGYDNWMRRVVTRILLPGSSGSTLVETRASYLDHGGREVISATWTGATSPFTGSPTLNPCTQTTSDRGWAPAISDLLATHNISGGCTLQALSRKFYDARGRVIEERTYVPGAAESQYTVSKSFFDERGSVAWQSSPGGAIQRNIYDALGRLIESKAVVVISGNEVALRKSTYELDTNGRTVREATWERAHAQAETQDSLGVTTYRYTWYDPVGKVLATMDVGSASTLNRFNNDTTEPAAASVVQATLAAPLLFSQPGQNSGARLIGFSPPTSTQVSTWNLGAVARVRLTGNEYWPDGRLRRSLAADGSASDTWYNGFGSPLLRIENSLASSDMQRWTAYQYENGKLIGIAALTSTPSVGTVGDPADDSFNPLMSSLNLWAATSPTTVAQVTRVVYGAALVQDGALNTTVSWAPNLIGKLVLPTSTTLSSAPAVTLKYYIDGSLAQRTDERGVSVTYTYDQRGRLVEVNAPDTVTWPGTFATDPSANGTTPDAITKILYTHDDAGRMISALAKSTDGTTLIPVVHDLLTYDALGNLTNEYQAYGTELTIGSTPPSSTAVTSYTWAHAPHDQGNYDRLTKMVYPARTSQASSKAEVTYAYGSAGSITDQLGLISSISRVHTTGGTFVRAAQYTYMGVGRRIGQTQGSHSTYTSTYAASMEFFSRDGSGNALAEYPGLTSFGEPQLMTFKNGAGTVLQDWQYGYTPDGKRAYARQTQATTSGGAQNNTRSWLYGYDTLGRLIDAQMGALHSNNQSILAQAGKKDFDWNLDIIGNWAGSSSLPGWQRVDTGGSTYSAKHATDLQNRLVSTDPSASPGQTDYAYDAAGNMVLDANYFYQYDAFNRLVLVSDRGSMTISSGQPQGTPGDWATHYSYDGLGRLIRRQMHWNTTTEVRSETYYYDGARRIQERFSDPIYSVNPITMQQSFGGYTAYTEREYVHGPGDMHGLDEYVAQIDRNGAITYPLQDAGGDVTAIVQHYQPNAQTSPAGRVVQQAVFDPYGNALVTDIVVANVAPKLKIGHKGLFYDRFTINPNAPPVDAASTDSGLYYMRNRFYSAPLGRFISRDPNASGLPTSDGVSFGTTSQFAISSLDLLGAFQDGANLYSYSNGAPTVYGDPLGLYGLIEGLFVGWDMADQASDQMDQAYNGVMLQAEVGMMIADYTLSQLDMTEWSTDWSRKDSEFDAVIVNRETSTSTESALSGFMPDSGVNPAMSNLAQAAGAKSGGAAPRKPLWKQNGKARKHGSGPHMAKMRTQVGRLKRMKVPPQNIRTNQVLVAFDHAGRPIPSGCNLKPDTQGFRIAPGGERQLFIGESTISQTADQARAKWRNLIPILERRHNVKVYFNVD